MSEKGGLSDGDSQSPVYGIGECDESLSQAPRTVESVTAAPWWPAVQDRVVGVASYVIEAERFAVTESLAVDPDWLGKGIGLRLHRARLAALRAQGITRVRTEADRPRTIAWYVKHFGYRITGTVPKKHAFGLEEVAEWTVLELDLGPEG